MTRLQGRPRRLPDAGRSSPNGDAAYLSKLPADAPEVIAKHTVYVTDPARILAWSKDDRQRNFNLLVRRYKNQLLYGCKEPNCTTPTCFTFRKRVADGPLRRFTDLSARTVACYLASQDNPERGLCRNEPMASRNSFVQDGTGHSHPPSTHDLNRSTKQRANDVSESHEWSSNLNEDNVEGVQEPTGGLSGQDDPPNPSPDGTTKDARRLKDPKSFTQNLFDTLALRMVEWLPLKRSSDGHDPPKSGQNEDDTTPTSRFHRRDTRKPEHERVPGKESSTETIAEQCETGKSKSSNLPSHSGGTTAVELKIPGSPVKRLSLGELEHWRPPLRTLNEEKPKHDRKPARKVTTDHTPTTNSQRPLSPPAVKHRPQKQKDKRKNSDTNTSYRSKVKPKRRVSWDGSQDSRGFKHANNDHVPAPVQTHQQPLSPTVETETKTPESITNERQMRHVQSLSCLSKNIIDGLEKMMFETEEEWEDWKYQMREFESRGYDGLNNWRYATRRQRRVFPFIAQSIHYVFTSPSQLLESFHGSDAAHGQGAAATDVSLDTTDLEDNFRRLYHICPLETPLHSLWLALENFFVLPREFCTSGNQQRRSIRCSTPSDPGSTPRLSPRGNPEPTDEYIADADAARIVVIVLFALTSSIPHVDSHAWQTVRQIRASGTVLPDHEIRQRSESAARLLVDVTDKFEHDLALRLLNRLARVVAARLAFHEMSKTRSSAIQDLAAQDEKSNVVDLIIRCMQSCVPMSVKPLSTPFESSFLERPTTMPMVTVEWLRSLLLKEWDGNPMLTKSSAAGGALELLSSMYRDRDKLALQPEDFHTPFLSERLDPMEMPLEWIGILPNNRSMHLLSYSFMFPPSALVTYFRALNYSVMSKSYENAMTASRHVTQTAFSNTIPIEDDVSLLARLKTSISTYLVLIIRRDNVLIDALNQLWRRERRELMRPLKVQMGMDEGEEGVDHGGVQQEFFRVAMAEALDSSFGMFTVDGRSGMSWFQPCSLEPLYKYELLGLLLSLAVYNGLTVPVNFPVALYRKLLGLKVKSTEHVSVGWPDLAKGLDELLAWKDGDVGDIFMRTYEFSFEAFGDVVTVDMERTNRNEPWPAPERIQTLNQVRSDQYDVKGKGREYMPQESSMSMLPGVTDECQYPRPDTHLNGILKGGASRQRSTSVPSSQHEASLVTNANRELFVKDYIFWLTDKSIRPQYEAFARGFYTCLDRTALSIFTPESLKTVVEGLEEIDIGKLEQHARYEGGFDANHRVIKEFWHVVRRFSQKKRSQLLEFVTACDRVPVSGISSIMFVIQKNGTGDNRLPTSLTCFGRLLLPEYSSRKALRENLNRALENAKGFGVA